MSTSISYARGITGFEKMDFGEGECDSGCEIGRNNSGNQKKTSFEYDEYAYLCNRCLKKVANEMIKDPAVVIHF